MSAARDPEMRELLAGSFLFRDVDERIVDRVLESASWARFEEGETMIGEGEAGVDLLLIREGRVQVSTSLVGEKVDLAELGPGAIVGEVAAVTGAARTSTVVARSTVDALAIAGSTVRRLAEEHPRFKAKLERLIEARARHTISFIPGAPTD